MITQKLLDDIKSHEEYFFSFFRVALPTASGNAKDGAGKLKKGANSNNNNNNKSETPLRPEQVDKVVKQALNRLKAKQDLVKKRSSGLTKEAANAGKKKGAAAAADGGGGVGKAKKRKAAREGDGGDDDDDDDDDDNTTTAPKTIVKSKKKKVDKKDKKERRKVDLKGRSAKKDAKNKAAKGGNDDGTGAGNDVEDVSGADDGNSDAAAEKQQQQQFMFGKIETTGGGQKKQMGKDFKKHLKNLQEEKSKIAQAKGEDQEKGEALEEKFAWKNVMQKAQGVKVKDDEALIKKSIKRKENIKKQSQRSGRNARRK